MKEDILKWICVGVCIGALICLIIDFIIIFVFLSLGKFLEAVGSIYYLIFLPFYATCKWEKDIRKK